jgi:hypothetical protein
MTSTISDVEAVRTEANSRPKFFFFFFFFPPPENEVDFSKIMLVEK